MQVELMTVARHPQLYTTISIACMNGCFPIWLWEAHGKRDFAAGFSPPRAEMTHGRALSVAAADTLAAVEGRDSRSIRDGRCDRSAWR
jgi:hypothetical protein